VFLHNIAVSARRGTRRFTVAYELKMLEEASRRVESVLSARRSDAKASTPRT
jgi:hypothetical protein